ncbi:MULTISPECIES: phosphoheptose isomerase [Silvimonas]|uniref:Phosphoheptose isomerase n=2 Tax=Silvimonas TaxID=300264 RepID=A0ABQ2P9W4_9NEIS|nr:MULTISPECIES: phosphoheptose isomerase [Silvimonas]GGP21635.1 phosphoheptose isomerase [Silvimonas iriomotensis]GGP26805.1 phosphoheptose isomerase [Silvimonas amylolytica]
MDLMQRVRQHFDDGISAAELTREILAPQIAQAAERLMQTLIADGKILTCGNGGSAADAQYFATEMVGRFERERPGLSAIALSTDTSAMTAIANDYDFDMVFSRQVHAIGRAGDVLLAISTSGNSANVISAIHAAHDRQMSVIALTGRDGGQVADILSNEDTLLCVPVERSARIKEMHVTIIHAMCDAIDYLLLGGE